MNAEISKPVPSLRVVKREWAAGIGWRCLRPPVIDGNHLTNGATGHELEAFANERSCEQRMSDSDVPPHSGTNVGEFVAIGRINGERFLDIHVTAAPERCDR